MFGGIKTDKYDQIFSLYIRCRDRFTCTRCGGRYRPPKTLEKLNKSLFDRLNNPAFGDPMGLHCSHFWGRVNKSVRYEPLNADSHCFACHMYLSGNPHEFVEWKKRLLEARYGRIVPFGKKTKDGISPFEYLEQQKNQIKQYKKGKIKGKKWDQRDEEVLEYFKQKIREL